MAKKSAAIFLILLLLGAGYFLLFWLPNATGARDQNMLSVFSPDEFAQYPHALRMMEPGKSLSQSLYRFFAYQHYYYGFPFYFTSAVAALLPVKLVSGLGSVALNVLWLRQVISVLPMIAALMILVYLQTGFRSYPGAILSFVLLLSVPEVVANDLWWHPESLVFLFVVLTFFFLVRDQLSFRTNFLLAAVFCGLTVGTKLIGLFFFLTIPVYILLGWHQKRIDLPQAARAAAWFVAILFAAAVLSNPFLVWASERAQALTIHTHQARAMFTGFVLAYGNSPWSWLPVIDQLYGQYAFLLLAVAALLLAVFKGRERLLNLLILTWAVPFTIYLFAVVVIRPKHFFLPILLPVFSSLPAYFTLVVPARFTRPALAWFRQNSGRLLLFVGGLLLVGWQFAYNLQQDVPQVQDALNREKDSPALRFYADLAQGGLSRIVLDRRLVVYRDVQMYVAPRPDYDVRFQWGTIDYNYLSRINADLLVLSKQRLRDYTQAGAPARALDPGFGNAYRFYKDAMDGNVTGYTLLYQDDSGMAYLSTPLYQQFIAAH